MVAALAGALWACGTPADTGRAAGPSDEVTVGADGERRLAHELVVRRAAATTASELAAAVAALGATTDPNPGLLGEIGFERVHLPPGLELDAARQALLDAGVVESAEPDYLLDVEKDANDPSYGALWGLQKIAAPAAWEQGVGSSAIVVAVLDTGVDRTHADLTANLWQSLGEQPGNGVDDDGNGLIDDVAGWDFANGDADPSDDHGHGTHVSGTIGAVGDNSQAVVGVSWKVTLLPIKVCKPTGCQTTHLAEGLLLAAKNGARVANASLGGFHAPLSYEAAAIASFEKAGGLLVAAAGNSATNIDDKPFYPASYPAPNVVAVAATDQNDALASFSNFGVKSVHVAAPGVGIVSTVPGGTQSMSGTSMAAPHVAGAAALWLAKSPAATPGEVKTALLTTSAPVAALKTRTLHGRLELEHLVTGNASCPTPGCQKPVTCADAPCSPHATCSDAPGGATCTCKPGFSGNGASCQDVDECANGAAGCDGNAECSNTEGGFSCTCIYGFGGDGQTCSDVDECAAGVDSCFPGSTCKNENGGYSCDCGPAGCGGVGEACQPGLSACDVHATCTSVGGSYFCNCNPGWVGDGFFCFDVDECTPSLNDCDDNALCLDHDGGHECQCKPGWKGDGKTCSDEDECALGKDACDPHASCQNLIGSYACSCDAGWQGDGKSCVDVDECAIGAGACGPLSHCVNVPGTWACACNAGYVGDGVTCTDVDECTLGSDDCDPNATCTNTVGGFTCACNPGWQGNGKSCTDLDECATGKFSCIANAECQNLPGSYTCKCKPGFSGDGKSTCVDTDECKLGTYVCDAHAVCVNTAGGYDCQCAPGYAGDGKTCADVDECALGTAACSPQAICANTVGSYTCTCLAGWVGNGKSCADLDECAKGAANCGKNSKCENTPGAYHCACLPGFELNGQECDDADECLTGKHTCNVHAKCLNTHGGYMCACQAGYVGDGFDCKELDECAAGLDDCDESAVCTNASPGYTCACKPGFSGNGKTCADVDECATGTHGCAPGAACHNTLGGHLCVCPPGTQGNGKTCSDIDECATGSHDCDPNATCVNAAPGFTCSCKPGFTGTGKTCSDVNECAGAHGCAGTCINTPGSYYCGCPPGYAVDGKSCVDVNECANGSPPCDPNAACTNLPGSYQCTCNPGYSGSGKTCSQAGSACTATSCSPDATCTDGPGGFSCKCKPGYAGDGFTCSDVDECATGGAGCSPYASCKNLPGSYACTCKAPYTGNGTSCDYDECALGTHNCHPNAFCSNTPSSFVCTCKPGYQGSGTSCADVDECTAGTDDCDPNAICTNTPGAFACSCKPGFSGTGKLCLPPPASVIAIAAGGDHSCAVLDNGGVRCWGRNDSGELGLGHTQNVGDDEAASVGPLIALGAPAVAVAVGGAHSCALSASGEVRCWGRNAHGQLGYGHTLAIGDDETPAALGPVQLGAPAIAVAAGGEHTCALTSAGAVRCWGLGVDGQLGYGSPHDVGNDELPKTAGDVPLGGAASQIVAGRDHTCALLGSGKVRCWGRGLWGQLGYGNSQNIGDGEPASAGGDVALGAAAVELAAGWYHTCARLSTGSVRCWGYGAVGQLGLAETQGVGDDELPVSKPVIALGASAAHISAGLFHTCVRTTAGGVRCFGYGESGRLGYANLQTIGDDEHPLIAGDVSVGGSVTQIALGTAHSCALTTAGKVVCWGDASQGQLGAGNTHDIGDDETPSGVAALTLAALDECALKIDGCSLDATCFDQPVGYTCACNVGFKGDGVTCTPLGTHVTDVVAGGSHTCALLSTGAVRCFGLGSSGQLGYGNTQSIGDDEQPHVAGNVPIGGAVTGLVAGQAFTCGLLSGGAVRCFGAAGSGQLGRGNKLSIGDDEKPDSAGDLPLGFAAVKLAAGGSHACALSSAGSVRCWGFGDSGRLGYASVATIGDNETPQSMPWVQVGAPASDLTAGLVHTCALSTSGSVRCWGSGLYGQLGYGNTQTIGDDEHPAAAGDVPLGATAVQVVAGHFHTCALMADGGVRCWGYGYYGALGYGNKSTIGDDEPASAVAAVPLAARAVALAAGGGHTCALLETGQLSCWGASAAALGYGKNALIGDDESPASAGAVPLGGVAFAVTAGDAHTCALLAGGITCFGDGASGRLGYASTATLGDDETPATKGLVQVLAP